LVECIVLGHYGDWLAMARPDEADHGKNKIYQVPAGSSEEHKAEQSRAAHHSDVLLI